MNDEEMAAIKALGDLTDSKNNPLVPTGTPEPIDPLLTPEGNWLIPPDAYQVGPGLPSAAAPVEVPDRPSVEFIEETLAKFIEGASAADLERLKAALGLQR